MRVIWLNNIQPVGVHMFCMKHLSCLFCVLTFRLMNLRQVLALHGQHMQAN